MLARGAVFVKKKGSVFFFLVVLLAVSGFGIWYYDTWKNDDKGETIEITNGYITKPRGETLSVTGPDGIREYKVSDDAAEQIYEGIGDLTVRDGEVKKMVCKPDKITGKILAVKKEGLELENYGELALEKECGYYKKGESVTAVSPEELMVGQTGAEFVVAQGKICAVLLTEEKTEEGQEAGQDEEIMIRVLIKTDNFAANEHSEVKFRGTGKIYIKEGKEERECPAGEEIAITPGNMKKNRITVRSEEGGRIQLMSVKRSGKHPVYRGSIEVARADGGLHLINELSLEQYLYGVVPSEMPAEYEGAALQAQAVCARSYAVQHRNNNRLKELGAHVDDSTSYQVYNNTAEDERCSQAVDATKGKLLYHEGKVVSAYFFSTACGTTTSAKDVAFSTKELSYLRGKLQEKQFPGENEREKARLVADTFGNEDLFRRFLEEDRELLEKEQPWYRWSTTISKQEMGENVNARIGARCQASGDRILVKQPDGTYQKQQINSIGQLKRVKIKKRGDGGVVSMAVIVGTEATVRVYSEYNIRSLLFHESAVIQKQDGTSVSGLSLLPSGFFVMDASGSSYEIRGGGFGHGTGMSQTGANELAKAGRSFEEILGYYFDGVEVR